MLHFQKSKTLLKPLFTHKQAPLKHRNRKNHPTLMESHIVHGLKSTLSPKRSHHD